MNDTAGRNDKVNTWWEMCINFYMSFINPRLVFTSNTLRGFSTRFKNEARTSPKYMNACALRLRLFSARKGFCFYLDSCYIIEKLQGQVFFR